MALLHPTMPFVTEEIWSFHPAQDGHLVVHPFPVAEESLFDAAAEADVEGGIGLTQRLRAWRDLAGVPAAAVLPGRVDGVDPPDFVARLARFDFDHPNASGSQSLDPDAILYGDDPRVAAIGPVRILPSDNLDPAAVAERLDKRREELRAEVERGERKLANEGFLAKAPAAVVEEERGKLERYRAELAELA